MLKLYYSPLACSMASHLALEESSANYEAVRVNIRAGENFKPEFLRINPRGFVPALVTDRGVLTENTAILSYVAQQFPEANLAPAQDAFGLARITSFNAFLATTIHITLRHFSRPRLFAEGAVAHAALIAKVPEMLNKYFGLIEAQLADGREWVHGDNYSTSDPYLFIYTSYLFWKGDRGRKEDFPHVLAHRERVLARPATQRMLEQEGISDPASYGKDYVVLDSPESEAALARGELIAPVSAQMSECGC